ncbi:MAG: uroporphyrinogen decarboxylase family protein [Armatimonadetes bacterium]|nr:uroporphyrinogen decarboxylase family protein [Armatimonadota bacterium]
MIPKERITAALEHKPTDRVPIYHCSVSSRTASLVLGREAYVGGGIQQWRESAAMWSGPEAHREFIERTRRDTIDLAKALDVDMVRPSCWRMTRKPTRRLDEYTFLYGDPEGSWEVMRFDPETELYQTVDRSPQPEPTESDIEAEVERLERGLDSYDPKCEDVCADAVEVLKAFGGERAVPGMGVGVGVPNRSTIWFEMIAARPDLVKRYIEVQTEYTLKRIRCYRELDVQVMLGGGDMAWNEGPIYSPRFFREVMAPAFERLTSECNAMGKYYFFASDGNLWPIADDVFPIVDGFYEIDRRAGMDLRKLRERFPHLTLIGNISSHTLHMGTKYDVIEETRDCLQAAKELGGIIVGVSNLIVCQTPPENFFAMLETIRSER